MINKLKGYLGTELEGLDLLGQKVKLIGIKNETYFIDGGNIYAYGDIQDFKPILRPLSDLTKYCDDLGFVPIEELNDCEYIKYYIFNNENKYFLLADIQDGYNILEPFSAKDRLLEWHFDIYGLIEQNLAIDKNTIK